MLSGMIPPVRPASPCYPQPATTGLPDVLPPAVDVPTGVVGIVSFDRGIYQATPGYELQLAYMMPASSAAV